MLSGDYFLKDNTESGGITLDYETVYANASEADYWRIVNSFDGDFSYDALKRSTTVILISRHGKIKGSFTAT